MIIYHAHLKVKLASIQAFETAAQKVVLGSQKEAGNIQYKLYQHTENKGEFVIIEIWQDREAIACHKETEHYQTFKKRLPNFLMEPHNVEAYEGNKLN